MTARPELPFDEPWQARAFALTQALIEAGDIDRESFRASLIAAIADQPTRPYWESWVEALEARAKALERT
jgi:Nitrile hydratase beta subunit, N-terminal